jgi:DME family drug/metabolite transporter
LYYHRADSNEVVENLGVGRIYKSWGETRPVSVVKILAAATLWSTIGVAATYGRDVLWMAFVRSLVAAAFSLAARPSKRGLLPGLLLGGLFSAYPLAALYAGVGTAAYLLYTAPLWTATALALTGEKPTRRDVAAVVLVLAAVFLMVSASLSGALSPVGLAAGLASGAFYGLYIAVARRLSAAGEEKAASLGAMAYTPLVTAPLLLLRPDPPPPEAVAAGLYLGVFGTVVPYRLFASAVKTVGGTKASVVATVEPVLAAVWGYLLFSQAPDAATLAAYALITAAAVIASLGGRR